MIQELYPEYQMIDEAQDGEEMQQKIRNNSYDLIFVDVNMPKKSGLDVVESCHECLLHTQCCILSGYADFEYAKRAISLGIKEYLLKPLDIEELSRVLRTVRCECKEKRWNQHLLYEKTINQNFWYADMIGSMSEMAMCSDKCSLYVFFLDVSDNYHRQLLCSQLYDSLSEYLKKNIKEPDQFAIFFLQTGECCLLVEGNECDRVKSYLKIHGNEYGQRVKITGIYTSAANIASVYKDKQLILALSPLHILEDNYNMISLEKMCAKANVLEYRFFCEKLEQLTSCYLTNDYAEAINICKELNKDSRFEKCYVKNYQKPLKQYLSIVWNIMPVELGTETEDFNELLNCLELCIQKAVSANHGTNSILIQQIKEYIQINYMNNISIADIGDQFGITPTYISRIFKEKTGEKLIDYITGIRMKKSWELLLNNSNIPVKDVAKKVGYTSEKHFSKIFKKYYQCTPTQIVHKNNLGGKENEYVDR